MCVTFCHRRRVLYWNHESCSFDFCSLTVEEPGRCQSCRYRQGGDFCGLTRAALPAPAGRGGCCHWNVELVTGPQPVTLEMLAPLDAGPEPAETLLSGLDAPYEVDPDGRIWIDPDRLDLPEVYGLGTEALAPEWMDWMYVNNDEVN